MNIKLERRNFESQNSFKHRIAVDFVQFTEMSKYQTFSGRQNEVWQDHRTINFLNYLRHTYDAIQKRHSTYEHGDRSTEEKKNCRKILF